jgi:uncharacterized membrane protein YoaK (UPF0700 family)
MLWRWYMRKLELVSRTFSASACSAATFFFEYMDRTQRWRWILEMLYYLRTLKTLNPKNKNKVPNTHTYTVPYNAYRVFAVGGNVPTITWQVKALFGCALSQVIRRASHTRLVHVSLLIVFLIACVCVLTK